METPSAGTQLKDTHTMQYRKLLRVLKILGLLCVHCRWSDQGAFTGEMTSICLKLLHNGKRWFEGKKINQDFEEAKRSMFGYLFDEDLNSDEETDDEDDNDEE